jgi:DNA-binding transcriptional LysR family regulator
VQLNRLDLNLLRVFDAVMEQRSVVRAGARLGLSPSAVSHALNRLRGLMGDKLFVREHDRMRPTPLAAEIGAEVHDTILRLQLLMRQPDFQPAESTRQFAIACSDYSSAIILPHLLKKIAKAAPSVELRVLSTAVSNVAEELDAGRVDMAIGIFVECDARFEALRLSDIDLVYVTSGRFRGRKLTIKDLSAVPHIVVTLSHQNGQMIVDDCVIERGLRRNVNIGSSAALDRELARRSVKRRVAAVVPHPLAVPMLLKQLDAIAMLPRKLAEELARNYDLRVFEDPCGNSPGPISVIWHERARADGGVMWLRDRFAEVAREVFR